MKRSQGTKKCKSRQSKGKQRKTSGEGEAVGEAGVYNVKKSKWEKHQGRRSGWGQCSKFVICLEF